MIKRIKRHINGIKRYYKRDGLDGVVYYIKHRFYNQLIRPVKYSDLFIPFSPERLLAKKYEETFPVIDDMNFSTMGNYSIYNKNNLSPESVIYSLGVLSDTQFDDAISHTYGCSVYLFDPSNIAKDHIEKVNNPKFVFSQVGVWKETCDIEFSTPKYGGSPSMILKYDGKHFVHRCVDLKEILEQNNHTHIDLVKMDIEGAAFGVINRMLDIEVYPGQIIAEFERPRSDSILDYFGFYSDLMALNERLVGLGYRAYVMPREKFKYYSIELIFVRLDH
ncbi:FkbM family methyltransferase [Paraneptunicella aestuarii]|uniref:FkbM family methyltransferase n=1 Tax=Paraneptunicella aestuarii TaxID=2831148 RepID=UPI001E459872|nr:FkbM family methyltransferase [Paraneptunicella aestuarii]UAA39553.1 FkbM family methyltransferase [Paraneptunicella aestuarii]